MSTTETKTEEAYMGIADAHGIESFVRSEAINYQE